MKHKELERWHRLNIIKRALQVLVVVAVLVCAGFLAAKHLWEKPPEKFEPAPPPDKDEGIVINKFQYSSPGANPWELEAESATVSKALDRVVLVKPRVVYHGSGGDKIELSADRGDLDKKSAGFSVKGNVKVRLMDILYETDKMEYSDKSRMVRTNGPISLQSPDLRLTGTGLTIDVDRQEAVIHQHVKATLSNVKWVGPGERLPL